VDHRAHQGLRAGEAVGHALCRHAAVALAVAHHVFDQTQAEQQQQGDGASAASLVNKGFFKGSSTVNVKAVLLPRVRPR
jgi:hypothetical protein